LKLRFTRKHYAAPLAGYLLLAAAAFGTLRAQSTDSTFPKRSDDQTKAAQKQRAAEELKQEERQRILGIVPNFNTTSDFEAEALSASQKFDLAFRGVVDPFSFVAAAADAAYSQATRAYAGYGQGMQGYGKRAGAAYADSFDGSLIGNAVFPTLLHEDPRYFRKGSGSIGDRVRWALLSAVRCRNDDGAWTPNFGNVLGNLAAGGISNLYYPASDRGVDLTFERAFTVTAEDALGSLAFEFWPDIQRKFLSRRHR
jgi:hypothetical protein